MLPLSLAYRAPQFPSTPQPRYTPLMFESKTAPLLSRRDFLKRQARFAFVALALVAISLAIGMAGYHFFENLSWLDSLLNASMLLGGMGPVDPLKTDGGKLFASFYALYSGLIVLVVAGVLFAPIFHRILHNFHLDTDDEETEETDDTKPKPKKK
jgi:hypothetical protein